jgi:hypothetical protein
MTIKELEENTRLPEKELIKQVQSLFEAKLLLSEDSSESTEEQSQKPPSSTIVLLINARLYLKKLIFNSIKMILFFISLHLKI